MRCSSSLCNDCPSLRAHILNPTTQSLALPEWLEPIALEPGYYIFTVRYTHLHSNYFLLRQVFLCSMPLLTRFPLVLPRRSSRSHTHARWSLQFVLRLPRVTDSSTNSKANQHLSLPSTSPHQGRCSLRGFIIARLHHPSVLLYAVRERFTRAGSTRAAPFACPPASLPFRKLRHVERQSWRAVGSFQKVFHICIPGFNHSAIPVRGPLRGGLGLRNPRFLICSMMRAGEHVEYTASLYLGGKLAGIESKEGLVSLGMR